MIRSLLLLNLGQDETFTDKISNYVSPFSLGEVCFAYNGKDIIGWVVVIELQLSNDTVIFNTLNYQFDGE